MVLYEAEDSVGGYLRFGIPDFKLNKDMIDRRLQILEQEGITFKTSCNVGRDISIKEIKESHDAVCITIGARKARDLKTKGRETGNVFFALEYLSQQNRSVRVTKSPRTT